MYGGPAGYRRSGKRSPPNGADLSKIPGLSGRNARVMGPRVPGPPKTHFTLKEDLKVAVVGRFLKWEWGQHPDEAYFASALESLGVKVLRVQQDGQYPPYRDADAAVFTGHVLSREKIAVFSGLTFTVMWTLDWLPDFPDRRPMVESARRVSLFLSSDQYDWKAQGIRHGYLPGACEGVEVKYDPKPTIPCAFIGSLYNERRKKIAETVKSLGGVVLDEPGKWVYGEKLAEFVQSVKVLVADNVRNDVRGYWSTRNYVVPGAGGFLLTPDVPGLKEQFQPGMHLATYRNHDALRGEIKLWIARAEERERIRHEGFKHVRENHNWTARAKAFLVHLMCWSHVQT